MALEIFSSRIFRGLAMSSLLVTSSGCGPKESHNETPAPKYKTGEGFVTTSGGKETVTFDLSAFTAGQQLVFAPFALGDTSSIDGANASLFTISWTIASKAATAAGSFEAPPAPVNREPPAFPGVFSPTPDNFRSFWNRFDPNDREDDSFVTAMLTESPHELAGRLGSHNLALRRLTRENQLRNEKALLTLAGGCPTSFYIPGSKQVENSSTYEEYQINSSEIASSYDGTDHCIVYVSNPVSEPSTSAIKASVRSLLDTYKNVIYKDSFADQGSYAFKPVIIVVDFSGPQWPSASKAPELQIAGAFFKGLSTQMKRPALYIAADLTKLSNPVSASNAKAIFHSTIAHEMQHAIVDYFKNRKANTGSEILAIDEGLAHLMEDVFGFGADNFDSYAKQYLSIVPDGIQASLQAGTSSALSNPARGGAQTLMYYLSGRQGGFTFKNGVVSESGGLAWIRSAVTSNSHGVANLTKTFNLKTAGAASWVDVIGGYFGALASDGLSDLETKGNAFDAPDTVSTLTDLAGTANKTFGMQFNNFKGLKDIKSQLKLSTADDLKSGIEVSYYQTQPILHLVKQDQRAITFDIPQSTNSGVAVVRVK